jgi:hypothetical protein
MHGSPGIAPSQVAVDSAAARKSRMPSRGASWVTQRLSGLGRFPGYLHAASGDDRLRPAESSWSSWLLAEESRCFIDPPTSQWAPRCGSPEANASLFAWRQRLDDALLRKMARPSWKSYEPRDVAALDGVSAADYSVRIYEW